MTTSQPHPHEVILPERAPAGVERRFNQIEPELGLRTDTRKIYPNDRGFADQTLVDITVANIRMMRIGENIHATPPACATVAPILHGWVRATPADRGTTPSTGAADANGR